MKRTSMQIEISTENATTWLPWVDDVGATRCDGYPDFSAFQGQTRQVLEEAWQSFLNSGDPLIIEPDPEPIPEIVPDWIGFNTALLSDLYWRAIATELESTPVGKDLKEGLVANAAGGLAEALRASYLMAVQYLESQSFPLDPAAIAAWNGYASTFNIPISFDLPT